MPNPWRRIREITQREGAASLYFRLIGSLYCRAWYLRCDLAQSNPVSPAKTASTMAAEPADFSVRTLLPADANWYCEFRRGAEREDFLSRLANGDLCFAAGHDPGCASVTWIAQQQGTLWMLGADFDLPPDETYVYDSFTSPAGRGQRLQALVFAGIREYCLTHGIRYAVTFVAPENLPNLNSRKRLGFEIAGRIQRVSIGPWVHFRSTGRAPDLRLHTSP